MAGSLNRVMLIGNIVRDPEIRQTAAGQSIASMTLATSERWKAKESGEQKERSEFHRVVVFSEGLASVVKNYVRKGSKLYLAGQLQTRKWTDKDGVEKYSTEVVLQGFGAELVLLDSKPADGESRSAAPSSRAAPATELLDDSIPF